LEAVAHSKDWLESAILAVSNAAALGAYKALEKVIKAAEESLSDRIFYTMRRFITEDRLAKGFEFIGSSGKTHHFDLAIKTNGDYSTLIDAVVPHHNSIAAKYVAFADMKERANTDRIAVYDNHIQPEDKTLLMQVADVMPIGALEAQAHTIAARLH